MEFGVNRSVKSLALLFYIAISFSKLFTQFVWVLCLATYTCRIGGFGAVTTRKRIRGGFVGNRKTKNNQIYTFALTNVPFSRLRDDLNSTCLEMRAQNNMRFSKSKWHWRSTCWKLEYVMTNNSFIVIPIHMQCSSDMYCMWMSRNARCEMKISWIQTIVKCEMLNVWTISRDDNSDPYGYSLIPVTTTGLMW